MPSQRPKIVYQMFKRRRGQRLFEPCCSIGVLVFWGIPLATTRFSGSTRKNKQHVCGNVFDREKSKKSNSITLTTYVPLSPPSPSRRSLQPTTIPRSTIAPGKECSCMSSTFLVTSSSFHILFSHNKAKKMQDTNHHAM